MEKGEVSDRESPQAKSTNDHAIPESTGRSELSSEISKKPGGEGLGKQTPFEGLKKIIEAGGVAAALVVFIAAGPSLSTIITGILEAIDIESLRPLGDVFVVTYPFTLAVTLVVLGFILRWWEGPSSLVWTLVILAVSAIPAHLFNVIDVTGSDNYAAHFHGPWLIAAILWITYIVSGYEIKYGDTLFVQSIVVAMFLVYCVTDIILPYFGEREPYFHSQLRS